jgi:hypothetical protein
MTEFVMEIANIRHMDPISLRRFSLVDQFDGMLRIQDNAN